MTNDSPDTVPFARPVTASHKSHAEKRPKPIGLVDIRWLPSQTKTRLGGVGQFLAFTGEAIRFIPAAIRLYPSEVFRFAGILVRGSSPMVLFMLLNLGFLVGLLANLTLQPLGLSSLNGAGLAVGLFRGLVEVILGWVVAAKIGCGLVTELGSMQINEEIDALEVMGIHAVCYLVSTRITAVFIVVPGMLVAGYWMAFWGGYLFDVSFLGATSEGAYWSFLWQFQNVTDFTIVTIWGVITLALVTLIACYFGYTVSGGPVGVGQNAAQSMLVSMVWTTILAALISQFAYGIDANSPIAN